MVRRITYCFPVCWRDGIRVAYVDVPEDYTPEDIEVLQQFVNILRQSVAGRETRKGEQGDGE